MFVIDRFRILNYNSESGKFVNVNGLAINSAEHFSVAYYGTNVLLTIVSGAVGAATGGLLSAQAQVKSEQYEAITRHSSAFSVECPKT